MKAIVMTCDRYRSLTEHMIDMYEREWDAHPFMFKVPFQNILNNKNERVEYIQCDKNIKETVLALLQDSNDEEWIYWCADDKYPIRLNVTRIAAIVDWLSAIQNAEISGVLYCRCRNMLQPCALTGEKIEDKNGHVYLERKGYEQIWIHQFVRTKVIRHLFEQFPSSIPEPRIMDQMKKMISKPSTHRLFVTQENLAVFGESTSRGIITRNCYKSLMKHGMDLPTWFDGKTAGRIVMGKLQ